MKSNSFEIPAKGKMRVPARIYVAEELRPHIYSDNALQQVENVACLPGIVKHSLAMPDIHWGYGFPIGGVAAFDFDEGIISPGGVGYDINCGVRLLQTNLTVKDLLRKREQVLKMLFNQIPSGVGSTGPIKLSKTEEIKVLLQGAKWAVDNGYGHTGDIDKIEESGCMTTANPDKISEHALKRGKAQLGTLGSGNHFIEVGAVQKIFDEKAARIMGLQKDHITVIIHTGSRGFGHQVCDDSIKTMLRASQKYGIELPDRQLCCAPLQSPEGQDYLQAMACAVNFAFCNRQLISHWVSEVLHSVFGNNIDINVVYEVAHNIAKIETHNIDGKNKKVCVHRKGATRAFSPNHPEIPEIYREIGQPILIRGDMGTCSYVLTGTEKAMTETFGSTCHGAGRVLSRKQAIKKAQGRNLYREMTQKGIAIMASSNSTIAEEMSEAYKDVSLVVDTVVNAGISNRVAKLTPLAVIKG